MATTMIPDDDLLAVSDVVTIWVASLQAPTDMWSLAEAISWVVRQPNPKQLTLFRPPGAGVRAAWVEFEQIERLAFALGCDSIAA